MPKRRAAASSTRTPSGTTSLPMPSPGMTAILCVLLMRLPHEVGDVLQQEIRSLLRDVMTAGQGLAVEIDGQRFPFGERVEAALDDAVAAPQHARGALDAAAGVAVGLFVLEVDGVGGAVVLAQSVRRAGLGEAALVLG